MQICQSIFAVMTVKFIRPYFPWGIFGLWGISKLLHILCVSFVACWRITAKIQGLRDQEKKSWILQTNFPQKKNRQCPGLCSLLIRAFSLFPFSPGSATWTINSLQPPHIHLWTGPPWESPFDTNLTRISSDSSFVVHAWEETSNMSTKASESGV